jgi:hypothetical protein
MVRKKLRNTPWIHKKDPAMLKTFCLFASLICSAALSTGPYYSAYPDEAAALLHTELQGNQRVRSPANTPHVTSYEANDEGCVSPAESTVADPGSGWGEFPHDVFFMQVEVDSTSSSRTAPDPFEGERHQRASPDGVDPFFMGGQTHFSQAPLQRPHPYDSACPSEAHLYPMHIQRLPRSDGLSDTDDSSEEELPGTPFPSPIFSLHRPMLPAVFSTHGVGGRNTHFLDLGRNRAYIERSTHV